MYSHNVCQVIRVHTPLFNYVNTILNPVAELSAGEEETTFPRAKHTKRRNQGENSDSSDGEYYQIFNHHTPSKSLEYSY